MKRVFEKIVDALAAAAFAEVGDYDGVLALGREEKREREKSYSGERIETGPAPRRV